MLLLHGFIDHEDYTLKMQIYSKIISLSTFTEFGLLYDSVRDSCVHVLGYTDMALVAYLMEIGAKVVRMSNGTEEKVYKLNEL